MTACAICGEHYPDFILYDLHMKMNHRAYKDVKVVNHIKSVAPLPPEEKKREWVPMDRNKKKEIVERVERRIGLDKFYGGSK